MRTHNSGLEGRGEMTDDELTLRARERIVSAHRLGRPETPSPGTRPSGGPFGRERGAHPQQRGAPLDSTTRLGRELLSLASRAEQAAAIKELFGRLSPEALAGLVHQEARARFGEKGMT